LGSVVVIEIMVGVSESTGSLSHFLPKSHVLLGNEARWRKKRSPRKKKKQHKHTESGLCFISMLSDGCLIGNVCGSFLFFFFFFSSFVSSSLYPSACLNSVF
jgi:hypothetical protein